MTVTTTGPAVTEWLGMSQNTKTEDELKNILLKKIETTPVVDFSHLEELLDELIAMGYCLLALKLIDENKNLEKTNKTFRLCRAEGVAAIYAGELDRAKNAFIEANRLLPSEPSPYTNIAQILTLQKDWQPAFLWLKAGCRDFPNHLPLWEVLWDFLKKTKKTPQQHLEKLATNYDSWAGMSLYLDVTEAPPQKKYEVFWQLYKDGKKNPEFLIELTGILGQNEKFEEILAVIWGAKQTALEPLPWKLLLHESQAYLALERTAEFVKSGKILLDKYKEIPLLVKKDLEGFLAEFS